MKRILALLGALAIAGALSIPAVAPVAAFSPTLTLDQPNPVVGQDVTFTGVYPKVPQARQPQYPNQPVVQVNCPGWQADQPTTNKISLGQAWFQSSYPFTLGGSGSCSAVLFYFDKDGSLVELAFAFFEVSP